MYCRVLACDFDGTGAAHGELAPELAAALSKARAQGFVTLLVTGRVHEEVEALCSDLSMFDAVVAENGAIVCIPSLNRTIRLGLPPPERFLGELRSRGVPFHAGAVVVGTWDRHAAEVLELIRRFAIDSSLVFNREAMMLLPSGINKAVGVRRALEVLGRSEHNAIAFGDAENDLALFALAEMSVAARGSVPAVAVQADDRLTQPGGAGVAQFIHHMLDQGGCLPTPPRHQMILGREDNGAPVLLPTSGTNVMVTGDPRSGKSWLAGLIAEHLLEQGYRLCVIDPEGDYLTFGEQPRAMVLGHELALPDPAAVPRLLAEQGISLILNLTSLSHLEQRRYVDFVLAELETCTAASGIPQWIFIDEAHYFFHEGEISPRSFGMTANFLFATYRPSLVSSPVFNAVSAHLITHTAVEEERYFITSLLQSRGPRDLAAGEALAALQLPRAALLVEDPEKPRWQVFTPEARVTAHTHHARKYVDTLLPESKAFHFLYTDGTPVVARNVVEFHAAVKAVPMVSLRHHLLNGDFSRWAGDVLGDEQLAHGLHKLERTVTTGASPDRSEILDHIEDCYRILPESLSLG
jgi:hydroxymethylpyrimidine pyrophosphatase-like HAD family hydrolase